MDKQLQFLKIKYPNQNVGFPPSTYLKVTQALYSGATNEVKRIYEQYIDFKESSHNSYNLLQLKTNYTINRFAFEDHKEVTSKIKKYGIVI
ncbi:hypothetical protein A3Q56_05975 [Intoshia linei]|uniref:Uncharacterized protein n=1 Tax=Intoshia linei TaxID=1819745 RepID=A0A177AWA3_9BILA|nr:hypothetical protein A3Q56_05975 [Intoshia linei]